MAFSSFHLYYDDLELGQEWESAGRTVTEADIVTFAGFSGDFNPMHVDHEYAKGTPFRRPIAHGFGVFGIASGLGVQVPPVRTVALLAVVNWRFLHPVFAGDTITVKTKVSQKAVRGRGRRGEVLWYKAILNQDGKVVQEGEIRPWSSAGRRPPERGGGRGPCRGERQPTESPVGFGSLPPLWGRVRVGGGLPATTRGSGRRGALPPTLTLPHKGGREQEPGRRESAETVEPAARSPYPVCCRSELPAPRPRS
jgi:acyl dehydratase